MANRNIVTRLAALATIGLLALAQAAAGQETRKLTVEADESLEWRQQDRQYIATGNAVAFQDDITMKASVITASYEDEGSEADSQSVNITHILGTTNAVLIKSEITARADTISYDLAKDIAILNGGAPTITAPGEILRADTTITYNRKTRTITADGNAVVEMEGGQKLMGQSLTAILTETEDDFEYIHAVGDAEVYNPTAEGVREAKSDVIEYTKKTGVATLTGSVVLVDGGNTMVGDKAEINTVTGISTMTSTGSRVGGVFGASQ